MDKKSDSAVFLHLFLQTSESGNFFAQDAILYLSASQRLYQKNSFVDRNIPHAGGYSLSEAIRPCRVGKKFNQIKEQSTDRMMENIYTSFGRDSNMVRFEKPYYAL